MSVKIIQLLAMPNDAYYQGMLIGLGDNGVVYENKDGMWFVYIPLKFAMPL